MDDLEGFRARLVAYLGEDEKHLNDLVLTIGKPPAFKNAGSAQNSIPRIANGDIKSPSFEVVYAIEQFLNSLDDGSYHGPKPEIQAPKTIPVVAKGASGIGDVQFTDAGYLAGEGMFRVERPGHVLDPHAFGVQVSGDSMEPRLHDGEIVIIDTTKDLANGDEVVIGLHSHERLIKRYRKKGDKIYLESWNPSYEPIIVSDEDVKFCFKIVDIRPR